MRSCTVCQSLKWIFCFTLCVYVCVVYPPLQVHEPYEASPGAGEAEQWELGKPHDLPALLPAVLDSFPAAVPHWECSQPDRILKYYRMIYTTFWHDMLLSKCPLLMLFSFLSQPIVRYVSWRLSQSRCCWNTWKTTTSPEKCPTSVRSVCVSCKVGLCLNIIYVGTRIQDYYSEYSFFLLWTTMELEVCGSS